MAAAEHPGDKLSQQSEKPPAGAIGCANGEKVMDIVMYGQLLKQ